MSKKQRRFLGLIRRGLMMIVRAIEELLAEDDANLSSD
jgi:hypothetical protein